jgi:hypothetical protein
LRRLVYSAFEFKKISNASPDMLEVIRRVEQALILIGQESSLNALRVQKYGIAISTPPNGEENTFIENDNSEEQDDDD